MLINPIKQNDVVTLVMNNGSEIVGSFESKDSNGNIKLKKPVALTMTETGAGFVPYSVSGETLDNPINLVDQVSCRWCERERTSRTAILDLLAISLPKYQHDYWRSGRCQQYIDWVMLEIVVPVRL